MSDKLPLNPNEALSSLDSAPPNAAPPEMPPEGRVYTRRAQGAAPAPQNMRRGKRLAVVSMVLGGLSVLLVLVHFFVSPLNLRLTGYKGEYFALLPMLAACGGIVLSIIGRKRLPPGQDSAATMGLISSIIGFVFGAIQLVACTFVLIGHFGL